MLVTMIERQNMKKILKIILIGCLILGILFFVLMKNSKGVSPVLSLNSNIKAGEVITSNMLKTIQVPNSVMPTNVVLNKEDLLGKTLSVPRLKGDYVPKEIVKKVNIELSDNEVTFSLRMPKDDTQLVQAGGEIGISLISSTNSQPLLVKGIYVMAINDIVNTDVNNSTPSDLIIAKTTETIGNQIAPYLKNNSYKILVLPQSNEIKTVDTSVQDNKNDTKSK